MCLLYLIKFPVMFLNGGFILSPDVHPETLLLTELSQFSLGVGVGGEGLAVLLLPGLNMSSEDPALFSIAAQISPPTPQGGPWKGSQPGQPRDRTVHTGRASSC